MFWFATFVGAALTLGSTAAAAKEIIRCTAPGSPDVILSRFSPGIRQDSELHLRVVRIGPYAVRT